MSNFDDPRMAKASEFMSLIKYGMRRVAQLKQLKVLLIEFRQIVNANEELIFEAGDLAFVDSKIAALTQELQDFVEDLGG
jgi:division protein CdvB (Snf7/Vps24/ESCRT-III family)